MERHSKTWAGRRKNRRNALLCFLLQSFVLLLVAIALHTGAIIGLDQAGHPVGGNQLMEMKQPLCVGNLLDRLTFEKIGEDDVINRRLLLQNCDDRTQCRLMSYTAQSVVTCLDALLFQAANNSSKLVPEEIIFIFIGDSRIRQQFFNFVKIIPNYDWVTVPSPIPVKYHGDIKMTSRILRLRVSFKWRPLINDKLIDTLHHIRETADLDPSERPQFILLSMATWHMLREHGADIALYQRRMTQLGPILASMSAYCGRIIWLHQYTSVDFYGDNDKSNTLVVSDKLRHYNEIAIRRLAIKSNDSTRPGVDLWDSSDPFANEYVRACAILKRHEHSSYISKEYATAYANCNDYVHTGYSALSQATQLLFNDLCNAHMKYNSMPIYSMRFNAIFIFIQKTLGASEYIR